MDSTREPQRLLGDAERHVAVERLAAGLAEGRLAPQEYDDRLGAVLRARTGADLVPVVGDLPPGDAERRSQAVARARRDLQEWLQEWRYWLGATVLMVGVWGVQSAADGRAVGFWPGVPLGIWAVVLLAVAVWPGSDGSLRDKS